MLNAHLEGLITEYKQNSKAYAVIKDLVVQKINHLLESINLTVSSVESRIKTEKSLRGKLEKKGDKYKTILDITDIVGARIITFYPDDVDKIAILVANMFEIDWENSIDKRKLYEVDRFGYMSLHYICKIPKEMYYSEELKAVNEVSFELQVRTVLQHAWASVEHDMGYKSDVEIPQIYFRRYSRLAGLLEMADEEFKDIRNSINDYRKKVIKVVKSGKFEDAELDGDSFNAYVETGAFDKLNKEIAETNNMDIVPTSLSKFLEVLKGFGFKTLGEVENMRKNYKDKAYQFAVAQFGNMGIDIISESVGITCLCIVYLIANGYGEKGILYFYNKVNGERKSNSSLAKRSIETAKKIGLVTE